MKKTRKAQAPKSYVPQERYGNTGHGFHEPRFTKRNRTRAEQLRSELKLEGY
jgi:hypothetical protein